MSLLIGTTRALLGDGVAVACSYLLRATFDAANQNYADAQVLDTVAEGVQVDSLTVVEIAGTMAISSNRCQVIGANSYTNTGFYNPTAKTRAIGRALLAAVECHASENGLGIGWNDSAAIGWAATYDYGYRLFASAGTVARFYNGAAYRDVATLVGGTVYQHALVLGGYDSNGVPWYDGAVGTYDYGCAVYIKGGTFTTWTLLFRVETENTVSLYPTGNAYGGGTNYFDNFRVPDRDYSAVLQPNNLSTFTAVNGTSLDAITPEVGGGWTEHSGTWDINANKARQTVAATGHYLPTVDAGISDHIVDCVITRQQVDFQA